jgi:hypothetical protein
MSADDIWAEVQKENPGADQMALNAALELKVKGILVELKKKGSTIKEILASDQKMVDKAKMHWSWWYGCYDSWFSFYDCMSRLGIEEAKKLEPFFRIAQSCGRIWAYWRIAVLTERPKELHLENNVLHNLKGPSVVYPDGLRVYNVHGVRVPQFVVEDPKSITVKTIDDESNTEIRRVMIDQYGPAKFIQDSGSEKIDEHGADQLYRREVKNDEPILMMRLVDSTPKDGVNQMYWERVPPTIKTVLEGKAWRFGLKPEEYRPDVET